jgi:hypothetical protein
MQQEMASVTRSEFQDLRDFVEKKIDDLKKDLKVETTEINRLVREQNGRIGKCEHAIVLIQKSEEFHEKETIYRQATCPQLDAIREVQNYILSEQTTKKTIEKGVTNTRNLIVTLVALSTLIQVLIKLFM